MMVYQDDGRPFRIQKELTAFNYDKTFTKGSEKEFFNPPGAVDQYNTDVDHLV